MPRTVIPLVTGETYHLFNRGVDKRNVFSDKADYFRFHKSLQLFNAQNQSGSIYELSFDKNWIKQQKPLVQIHAYCLLANHYHLIITQTTDGGVSEFMKRLGGGYTSYFNERYNRSGALFQGNYKRVRCESNEQLLYLVAYVNLNNKVHNWYKYFMSSFKVYTGEIQESFVHSSLILKQYKNNGEFVKSSQRLVSEIARQRKIDKDFDRQLLE